MIGTKRDLLNDSIGVRERECLHFLLSAFLSFFDLSGADFLNIYWIQTVNMFRLSFVMSFLIKCILLYHLYLYKNITSTLQAVGRVNNTEYFISSKRNAQGLSFALQ